MAWAPAATPRVVPLGASRASLKPAASVQTRRGRGMDVFVGWFTGGVFCWVVKRGFGSFSWGGLVVLAHVVSLFSWLAQQTTHLPTSTTFASTSGFGGPGVHGQQVLDLGSWSLGEVSRWGNRCFHFLTLWAPAWHMAAMFLTCQRNLGLQLRVACYFFQYYTCSIRFEDLNLPYPS